MSRGSGPPKLLANSALPDTVIFKQSSIARMTTRREYDLLNQLRRVESLSTATSTSGISFDSPGARKAKMAGDCVAEFGGGWSCMFCRPTPRSSTRTNWCGRT
jgi:hypothetical protein